MPQKDQVANYWDKVSHDDHVGFWSIPGWQEHQNLLASGNPKCSWIEVLKESLDADKAPVGHALSLGSGSGRLERLLIHHGLCKTAEGCDLSSERVRKANEKSKAEKLPITHFVTDLNNPSFENEKYDLIAAEGIFHHIENLEGLFTNIKSALKKDGKLIVFDYVGPTRFQWTANQTREGNAIIKTIPKSYRVKQGYLWHQKLGKHLFNLLPFANSQSLEKTLHKFLPQRLFSQFVRLKQAKLHLDEVSRPHPEQFLVTDPSEAVRSEEIIPLIKKEFTLSSVLHMGGSLAGPIFMRTAENFIKDQKGQKIVGEILSKERELVKNGKLESDYVAFIATPNY